MPAGTDVAVKLLLETSVTPETLESLKSEVAILSSLRHPNVVLYLGACTEPPNIFIVTEWCERGSLSDLLYDHTLPLSAANRLGMALQTCQGMAYLHSSPRKIIHRDLKSQNLLVTRDFTIKVRTTGGSRCGHLCDRRSSMPASCCLSVSACAGRRLRPHGHALISFGRRPRRKQPRCTSPSWWQAQHAEGTPQGC